MQGSATGRTTRLRLGWLIAAVALLGLPLVLLAPAMVSGKVLSSADCLLDLYLLSEAKPTGHQPANPLLSDPPQQFTPWRRLVVDEIRAGRWPFWNPHAYAGSPLLGNSQSAVFDPLCLPYLLFPRVDQGTVWVALLRMLVGSLGAFLLARELGRSACASALAGLVFGCGGFMVVWLLYPHTSSAAWLGFAMWAGERLARRFTPGALAGLAGTLALSCVGGHVEAAFFVALAVSAYYLLRRYQLRGVSMRGLVASIGTLAAAGALSALLAAAHIVPFLDALAEGTAGGERLAVARGIGPGILLNLQQYVAHLDRLILLLFPFLYGRPVSEEAAIGQEWTNFCEHSAAYGSVLGLFLAVAGVLWARRGSPARALALVGALAWLHYIWFPLTVVVARYLPLLQVASPERIGFVALFALALLAGFGLDGLIEGMGPRGRRVLLWCVASLVVAAMLAASCAAWLVRGAPGSEGAIRVLLAAGLAPQVPALDEKARWFFANTGGLYARTYLLPWAAVATSVAVFAVVARVRWSSRWLGPAVLVLVGVDLWLFAHNYNPAIPESLGYPETATLRTVKELAGRERIVVLDYGLVPNVATYHGISDLAGYDAINRKRLEELGTLAGAVDRKGPGHAMLAFERCDSAFFDVLAVRTVVASRPLQNPRLTLADHSGRALATGRMQRRGFGSRLTASSPAALSSPKAAQSDQRRCGASSGVARRPVRS
jgi:hypothetical protein